MGSHSVILLVEDREDDIALIQRAFRFAFIDSPLAIVRDGEQAIDYLKGTGKYCARDEYPLPDLILLDLKLPRVDGFEFLEWLRSQPGIGKIAVIVLTSSSDLKDVNRAYALGANSFLTKPSDFSNYIHLSRLINEFWMRRSMLPESVRLQSKSGIKSGDNKAG